MSEHESLGFPVEGQLCLDFANTALSEQQRTWLVSYPNLAAWGEQAGLLTTAEGDYLRQEAKRRPHDAAVALARAVELRDALLQIFAAIAAGRAVAAADLAILNERLALAQAGRQLVVAAQGFVWAWLPDSGVLDRLLWPVALAAAELLTAGELTRVKQCADASCGWLFIDTSRNRSRRWCAMSDCGNRAKARRFYQRSRSASDSSGESTE